MDCIHEFKIKGGEGTRYGMTNNNEMLYATAGQTVQFCIHCGRNFLFDRNMEQIKRKGSSENESTNY